MFIKSLNFSKKDFEKQVKIRYLKNIYFLYFNYKISALGLQIIQINYSTFVQFDKFLDFSFTVRSLKDSAESGS